MRARTALFESIGGQIGGQTTQDTTSGADSLMRLPNEYKGKSGAEGGDRTRTVLSTTGF